VAVSLAVFSVLGWLGYRRWVKKEINREMEGKVNQMVSQYVKFHEAKTQDTKP
jgi:hypothetical protein